MFKTPKTQREVLLRTIFATILCIVFASSIDIFVSHLNGRVDVAASLARNISISMLLAGPLFYLNLSKHRELSAARAQLQILASTDSLTSVLNRGAFAVFVDSYLNGDSYRNEPQPWSFLVIDADFFKKINDTHGHQIGDLALVKIADAIRACIRETDVVGRLGGEEFGVFLPKTEPGMAMMIAQRIRQRVERTPVVSGKSSECLSVSVGGATSLIGGTFEELFSLADRQLYNAKDLGRNRVEMTVAPHATLNGYCQVV